LKLVLSGEGKDQEGNNGQVVLQEKLIEVLKKEKEEILMAYLNLKLKSHKQEKKQAQKVKTYSE